MESKDKNLSNKKKSPEIKIKNMGVDIDKNEYREIVLSTLHVLKLLFTIDTDKRSKYNLKKALNI